MDHNRRNREDQAENADWLRKLAQFYDEVGIKANPAYRARAKRMLTRLRIENADRYNPDRG